MYIYSRLKSVLGTHKKSAFSVKTLLIHLGDGFCYMWLVVLNRYTPYREPFMTFVSFI